MSTLYAIPEKHIPFEFSFEDNARIMINGEMLDIIVLTYSESHVDNIEVSNMLSDSVSMYAYGALPVTIALSGMVKEARDGNHLYSVLKKYKTEWRQRLTTDYKKNTKLTIMDTVMDFAITGINIVQTTETMGYDTINIDGIGWNYTMPGNDRFVYEDWSEGVAQEDDSATPTDLASQEPENKAQDLNTPAEKAEEKKSEEQTPSKVMYKKEEEKPQTEAQKPEGSTPTEEQKPEGSTPAVEQKQEGVEAKVEQYSKEDNYKLLSENMQVHEERQNGILWSRTGTVTRTYIYNGKKVTTTKECTATDLSMHARKEYMLSVATTKEEKDAVNKEYAEDFRYRMQASHGYAGREANDDDYGRYFYWQAEAELARARKARDEKIKNGTYDERFDDYQVDSLKDYINHQYRVYKKEYSKKNVDEDDDDEE